MFYFTFDRSLSDNHAGFDLLSNEPLPHCTQGPAGSAGRDREHLNNCAINVLAVTVRPKRRLTLSTFAPTPPDKTVGGLLVCCNCILLMQGLFPGFDSY